MSYKSRFELWKSGALNEYIELGIIKGSFIEYCRLVNYYMKERENGKNYTEAVRATSEAAGASEVTVRRAIAAVI